MNIQTIQTCAQQWITGNWEAPYYPPTKKQSEQLRKMGIMRYDNNIDPFGRLYQEKEETSGEEETISWSSETTNTNPDIKIVPISLKENIVYYDYVPRQKEDEPDEPDEPHIYSFKQAVVDRKICKQLNNIHNSFPYNINDVITNLNSKIEKDETYITDGIPDIDDFLLGALHNSQINGNYLSINDSNMCTALNTVIHEIQRNTSKLNAFSLN